MRRSLLLFSMAVVVSGFAAMLAYKSISLKNLEIEKARVNTVEVAVARRDISLGQRLATADIKMVRYPTTDLPSGAILNSDAVVGSVARASFVTNEPIIKTKLFSEDPRSGVLPVVIPPGMRAISVQVDEVSDIAGFVLPHSHVDVALAVDVANLGQRARLVVQNVEVLAVAQTLEQHDDKPVVVHTVTVLVTPQEAEKLALASKAGVLRLVMRSFRDGKLVKTSGVSLSALVGGPETPLQGGAPARAAAAASPHVAPGNLVEVVVGTTRHTVAFHSPHQSAMQLSSQPSE